MKRHVLAYESEAGVRPAGVSTREGVAEAGSPFDRLPRQMKFSGNV